MSNTQRIGRRGEEQACRFLTRLGYHILTRNYYSRYGELDIVAISCGVLCFIEVKTRRTLASAGDAEHAVTSRKRKAMKKTALKYCVTHGISLQSSPIRFEVISIYYQKEEQIIRHYVIPIDEYIT